MTRRQLLATLPLMVAAQPVRRPNIVFIMADDLGYADLSCYGRRDYRTPNIDRLAAGGVRFTQAYANSPVCSPTRTALITGRYQYRLPVGLEEPIAPTNRNVGLAPEHPTLPSLLRKAGYATALAGKWHLGKPPDFSPLKSGYDRFFGFTAGAIDYFTHSGDLWDGDRKVQQSGYLTDLLGDRAVKWIGEFVRERRPFFLSLHFSAPHWPWEGPGDEAVSRRIGSLQHYDGGSMKTYAAMVTRLDEQVGRVLSAIGGSDTIVVFTSDNGGERFSDNWPFTGRKTELLEGGIRVPAIVRWPSRLKAGVTTEQPAITMDWMPTLLAVAGAAPDPAYPPDGIDLMPLLEGRRPPAARTLFWRYRMHGQRAVRDGDLKWLRIGDNDFLFDLAADPMERANLKGERPADLQRLTSAFDQWNAGMLPEDPRAYSHALYDANLADHYGVRRK